MADGTLRPIELVFKGDLVLATDPRTGATVARRVTALIRSDGLKDLAVVVIGGQRLIATDEHPVFTAERGWVAASELRRGEHVIDADGEAIVVEAVLDLERTTWVYNLTVEGLHTYYAGADPVLVHNAKNPNLQGGKFCELPTGTGKHRHHMPAKAATGDKKNTPSILMDPDDHMKTGSWGPSRAAKAYRARQAQLIKQGKYDEAFLMDVDDIQSQFGSKYDNAILEAMNALP